MMSMIFLLQRVNHVNTLKIPGCNLPTSSTGNKIIAYQKLRCASINLRWVKSSLVIRVTEFKLVIHIKLKNQPIGGGHPISSPYPYPIVKQQTPRDIKETWSSFSPS